jgi:hypothetical protein
MRVSIDSFWICSPEYPLNLNSRTIFLHTPKLKY